MVSDLFAPLLERLKHHFRDHSTQRRGVLSPAKPPLLAIFRRSRIRDGEIRLFPFPKARGTGGAGLEQAARRESLAT